MSSTAPVSLIPTTQLSTSNAILFTAGAGTTVVRRLSLTNVSASVATVTLYRVASGTTATGSNTVTSAVSIAPGQTYCPPEWNGVTLATGDSIQGFAGTATSINITAGGLLYLP